MSWTRRRQEQETDAGARGTIPTTRGTKLGQVSLRCGTAAENAHDVELHAACVSMFTFPNRDYSSGNAVVANQKMRFDVGQFTVKSADQLEELQGRTLTHKRETFTNRPPPTAVLVAAGRAERAHDDFNFSDVQVVTQRNCLKQMIQPRTPAFVYATKCNGVVFLKRAAKYGDGDTADNGTIGHQAEGLVVTGKPYKVLRSVVDLTLGGLKVLVRCETDAVDEGGTPVEVKTINRWCLRKEKNTWLQCALSACRFVVTGELVDVRRHERSNHTESAILSRVRKQPLEEVVPHVSEEMRREQLTCIQRVLTFLVAHVPDDGSVALLQLPQGVDCNSNFDAFELHSTTLEAWITAQDVEQALALGRGRVD